MQEFLEPGVAYDRDVTRRYSVGGRSWGWSFASAEFANIFAYLAAEHGASNAAPILRKIESKFRWTSPVFDIATSVSNEAKELALTVGPRVGGDWFMKQQAANPNVHHNDYDPLRDTDEYVEFLILSWCYSPRHEPYYWKATRPRRARWVVLK